MVKLSQIENTKNRKKPAVFRRTWGLKRTQRGDFKGRFAPLEAGFKGAQPLAPFWNFFRFRVPGNDILALDLVQTVLYTHMVITRFLYRSAGLNERQSLPKKPRSHQFSGFSSEMGVANSVVMTCPET